MSTFTPQTSLSGCMGILVVIPSDRLLNPASCPALDEPSPSIIIWLRVAPIRPTSTFRASELDLSPAPGLGPSRPADAFSQDHCYFHQPTDSVSMPSTKRAVISINCNSFIHTICSTVYPYHVIVMF
uniref:Secreted protein n=1 Tax=Panagrellus redivivus TaxID=6233 RepID=A0A7E5A050_PANRE